jgi:Zn-dependent protease with chaperone function
VSRVVLLFSLAFGAFAVVYVAATALAGVFLPVVLRRAAEARARLAFGLRLGPLACALGVAVVVALAFVRHEPADADERAGPVLLAAGAAGVSLLLAAAWRSARSLVLTRRLVREWLAHAEPLALPAVPASARRIESRFPVVAVAGVVRPRLFVARSVLERLSRAELRAVLDHERAHLARHDNLKRWLLHSCPDLPLLGGPGVVFRREWEEASEVAADDAAARRGRHAAESLASALVKVARMSPAGAQLSASATALLSEGSLRGRVERLLHAHRGAPRTRRAFGLWVVYAIGLGAAVVMPRALVFVHTLLETIVQILS